jgi:hypothetical protein
MDEYQSKPHPFPAQVSDRIAIHICSECNDTQKVNSTLKEEGHAN